MNNSTNQGFSQYTPIQSSTPNFQYHGQPYQFQQYPSPPPPPPPLPPHLATNGIEMILNELCKKVDSIETKLNKLDSIKERLNKYDLKFSAVDVDDQVSLWEGLQELKGLKIHQARTKCGSGKQQRERTVSTDETTEDHSQEAHHSAEDLLPNEATQINIEEEQWNQNQQRTSTPSADSRKEKIQWPPTDDRRWEIFDEDLDKILDNTLTGDVQRKISSLSTIVYAVGQDRFGVNTEGKKKQSTKSRKNQKSKERKREEESNVCCQSLQVYQSNTGRNKGGISKSTKEEVEKHLSETHSDERQWEHLGNCNRIENVPEPEIPKNTKEPSWKEVSDVVKKARSASSPGPNGIPYKVYKKCPKILKHLWRLLKVVWRKGKIPSCWQKAEGVLFQKKKNRRISHNFGQFPS
ncbi:unnamed protein product [Mytilus coruscus]|uniref:Uncharacterized protein n=1 Tax=Mytilus coruscus TaxID=42192 RepID=A0A6J8CB67_MYTCO|nr:unnamed protein product [Mytilus coruscus]